MDSLKQGCSDPSLCEVCTEIDFDNIAPPVQFCKKPRDQERLTSYHDKDLGTIEDIINRAGKCSFCALIAKHLGQDSLDQVGRCKLLCEIDYCISSDRTEFTRDGPHTHTTTAWVQFHPDATLLWAPLPWELEKHASHTQGVRQLFQLQASCDPPDSTQPVKASAIHGRRVLSLMDLNLPKKWLDTCERKHVGRCPHSSSTPGWETGFMPMFVIDIEHRCIASTPPNCRYVALSYVWGKVEMLKHTCANSTFLRTPDSLCKSDLPTTIRDAMSLVENMGEKYLWVDALCIIQDSLMMQQTQIAKMDQIYAKALFTIVAATGADADAGLPGVSPTHRQQTQEILRLPDGRHFYTLVYNGTTTGSMINTSTWAERAWTMQELLFSGRCLIFTQFQVYWKCEGAVWLEEVALEQTTSTNLEIFDAAVSARFPDRTLDPYDYSRLYGRLVANYMQRRLTYQSDLVNAFSGICGRLSAIQNDRFFWGLPESRFSWSLGWYLYAKQTRNYARTRLALTNGGTEEVPFPSWSWAAWNSGDTTPWITFLQSNAYSFKHVHQTGYEFLPVIDFWISDAEGTLVSIREPDRHVGSQSHACHTQHRLPWQGSESQLPEALATTDTTSSQRRPGLLYFWTSVAKLEDEELVVICRTDDNRPAQDLIVLTVEWREGVAYRLRATLYPEVDWLALKERQWKFVTLG